MTLFERMMVEPETGPDEALVLVRATIRTPSGAPLTSFGGFVPRWIVDDDRVFAILKRAHRGSVLSDVNIGPNASGYRVTWETTDQSA